MHTSLMAVVLLTGAVLIGWADLLRSTPDLDAFLARARDAAHGQSGLLAAMGPLLLGWTACGMFAGLVGRDRVKEGRGHSSPTAAWIGKRAAVACLTLLAAFAAGAWRFPPALVYAIGILHAMSWGVYLRNLPSRL